jgi:hypothetical protein
MGEPLVIHVVRHGRSRANRVGLVMGWSDESIEPDQNDAADAVAARLAASAARVLVVSSPLARARDTAAPLAAALSVDLATDGRLGELHQGPLAGARGVRSDSPMAARVVGVAYGARDARSRRARDSQSALCPGRRCLQSPERGACPTSKAAAMIGSLAQLRAHSARATAAAVASA